MEPSSAVHAFAILGHPGRMVAFWPLTAGRARLGQLAPSCAAAVQKVVASASVKDGAVLNPVYGVNQHLDGGTQVKVFARHDNPRGDACRLADVARTETALP